MLGLLVVLILIALYIGLLIIGSMTVHGKSRLPEDALSGLALPSGVSTAALLVAISLVTYHATWKLGRISYKVGQWAYKQMKNRSKKEPTEKLAVYHFERESNAKYGKYAPCRPIDIDCPKCRAIVGNPCILTLQ